MRFRFFGAFMLVLVGALTFWYRTTAAVCPAPLAYRLGQLDEAFAISDDVAKAQLLKAETVWEEEFGRELFYYDDNASFVVNFVFDERQEVADTEKSEREFLDRKKSENDAIVEKVALLQEQYDSLSESYRSQVSSHERDLTEYNERVSAYNDQGGAPSDVFDQLEREKTSLNVKAAELSKKADELNQLAQEINELGTRSNELVEAYNAEVVSYNKQFGYAREFTQGDYQGDKINVYKFSTEDELLAVLTHELGHALGIEHVDGESSVMYYLLKDTSGTPVLSDEDKAAFIAECGTGSEWSHRIRALIRSLLS